MVLEKGRDEVWRRREEVSLKVGKVRHGRMSMRHEAGRGGGAGGGTREKRS